MIIDALINIKESIFSKNDVSRKKLYIKIITVIIIRIPTTTQRAVVIVEMCSDMSVNIPNSKSNEAMIMGVSDLT